MQHDHVLNKLNFNILTLGSGEGSRGVGANICYHVAAFSILFNLLCNMTIF